MSSWTTKSELPATRASCHSVSSRKVVLNHSRRTELSMASVVRAEMLRVSVDEERDKVVEGKRSSVCFEVRRVCLCCSKTSSPFLGAKSGRREGESATFLWPGAQTRRKLNSERNIDQRAWRRLRTREVIKYSRFLWSEMTETGGVEPCNQARISRKDSTTARSSLS